LKAQGELVRGTHALGQRVGPTSLTRLFSLDDPGIRGREGEVRVVADQIMMLVAPHLLPPVKVATERMALQYLEDHG
ncbi:TetR family transcriptional regulator, partial [Pseudomonas sp. MWU13-2860]